MSEIRKILEKGIYCLVDVREPFELEHEVSIQGTINIPFSEFETRKIEILERKEPVLFFCKSGVRSEYAMLSIKKEGKDNVFNLGGYNGVKQLFDQFSLL